MFEESLVESTALLQGRSKWPAVLSIAGQVVLAVLVVAVPLCHPELLPVQARSFSLTPPPTPPPPSVQPPPQRVHVALASAEAFSAPAAPNAARSMLHTLLAATPGTVETAVASAAGPEMAGNPTSTLGSNLGTRTLPTVTAVPAASPARPARVNLSSGVTTGFLLDPIRPEYPSIARATGQQGSVVVQAIISRSGLIERAQVLSGPAMLQNAALQAVERARYKPYLLNGQPTEVETTITIHFRLGGDL